MDVAAMEAIGYEDGAIAAQESGSDEAPAGGWDAWTIEGIGHRAFFELFELGEHFEAYRGTFWADDPKLLAAAQAYNRGAQRGATEALATSSE